MGTYDTNDQRHHYLLLRLQLVHSLDERDVLILLAEEEGLHLSIDNEKI